MARTTCLRVMSVGNIALRCHRRSSARRALSGGSHNIFYRSSQSHARKFRRPSARSFAFMSLSYARPNYSRSHTWRHFRRKRSRRWVPKVGSLTNCFTRPSCHSPTLHHRHRRVGPSRCGRRASRRPTLRPRSGLSCASGTWCASTFRFLRWSTLSDCYRHRLVGRRSSTG